MLIFDAWRTIPFWNRCTQCLNAVGPIRKLAILASILFTSGFADAKIIYVNGANTQPSDGSTWGRAFTYLRDALDSSDPGDQIFVAKGTYYPDDGASGYFGDRELSFELDGVELYGGFAGTETSTSQRDPLANPTYLSGEIWSVTPTTLGYERYWSIHVVVLKSNSTIDGVTIERGRANGDESPYNQGGGVYVPNGQTVTLVNCTLRENLACESGGALWGTVIASGCTFSNNQVDNEFLKVEFKSQRAWIFNENCYGGAINGDVTADDCRFIDNIVNTSSLRDGTTTSANGGAINGLVVNIKGCVFDGNSAVSVASHRGDGSSATSRGGAIVGTVTAANCVFTDNSAQATADSAFTPNPDGKTAAAPHTSKPTTHGGAIVGQINAANCSFADNFTLSTSVEGDNTNNLSYGGALYVDGGSSMVNCSFSRNDSTMDIGPDVDGRPNNIPSGSGGGAVYASSTCVLPIMNSTFLDNTTTGNGTALNINGTVNVLSNIFWSTAVGDILIWVNANSAKARISNRLYPTPSTETINVVKGGIDGLDIVQSNADFGEPPERTLLNPTTPVLVDEKDPEGIDGIWGTADDGLRLAVDSVAIGKGHPLFIPKDTLDVDDDGNVTEDIPVDAANFARVQNGTLDLGAYEFGDVLLAPEIQVEQPGGAILVDGVGTVSLGAAPGVPSTMTFVIKNIGGLGLKRLSVNKSGINEGDFTITQPLQTTVGAGGSTTFTVKFDAATTGLRTATLRIISNDSDENPFDINLDGELRVPDIAVEYPNDTSLTDGSSLIDYGTVAVLSSSSKTFTVRNTGPGDLKILKISSSGTAGKDYTISGPAQTVIATGGTTTFKVAFAPTAKGTRNASITIESNDPDAESSFLVKVTGTGSTAPEIAVAQPSSVNLLDGRTKSFGSVKTGLSYTKTFTIRNVGSSNLKNLAISLSGASAFTKSKLSVSTLKPGEKTTFTVTFKPSSTGAKNATLKIASNDKDENPFDINLTGTGISGGGPAARAGLASAGFSLLAPTASPVSDSDGAVTVVKESDGLEYLVLTVPKTLDWKTAKRSAEVSPNLVDWFSGDQHTTTLLNDSEILRVRDNTPIKKGEKRYIRLK